MSLGVTYSVFLAGKTWLLAAFEALIYYSLVHPRSGCGPCRPCHKAEPWQELLPFTHFPSPGNIPRFGSMIWAARAVWGGGQQGKRLCRPQQASAQMFLFLQPLCKGWGGFFPPSADEFMAWGDVGMLLSSVPLKLLLWNISPDCRFPSRGLRADPTARPCSHLSTALRAAQGDLTRNNFHWLITGQNFSLN